MLFYFICFWMGQGWVLMKSWMKAWRFLWRAMCMHVCEAGRGSRWQAEGRLLSEQLPLCTLCLQGLTKPRLHVHARQCLPQDVLQGESWGWQSCAPVACSFHPFLHYRRWGKPSMKSPHWVGIRRQRELSHLFHSNLKIVCIKTELNANQTVTHLLKPGLSPFSFREH